ncbi:hypothetical protein [Caenimonas soli]|jgi:hypothetical protein|uniref:hypothetical protein n=1 Tax=Caenimonas soli TaxID=2735555 RepID=UPI00155593D3|nr:hypothetical protein [Caenimonas soli]NPC56286.1 hypothetical protein [Caenimonas soli]
MNSSQQSLPIINSGSYEFGNDAGRWSIEDEIPLGCECANPALQIERWGQEAPAGLKEPY